MVFIGGNKRQVKNELLEIICLSLEKFLTSIPFHKVGKNIKDFLLWFASPKTFPKIPKTIPWPWPQLVAIYTPLAVCGTGVALNTFNGWPSESPTLALKSKSLSVTFAFTSELLWLE